MKIIKIILLVILAFTLGGASLVLAQTAAVTPTADQTTLDLQNKVKAEAMVVKADRAKLRKDMMTNDTAAVAADRAQLRIDMKKLITDDAKLRDATGPLRPTKKSYMKTPTYK